MTNRTSQLYIYRSHHEVMQYQMNYVLVPSHTLGQTECQLHTSLSSWSEAISNESSALCPRSASSSASESSSLITTFRFLDIFFSGLEWLLQQQIHTPLRHWYCYRIHFKDIFGKLGLASSFRFLPLVLACELQRFHRKDALPVTHWLVMVLHLLNTK